VSILSSLRRRLLGGGPRPLEFRVAVVTDRGLVRAENQDAYVDAAAEGFLCVADGMGGGEGGARASAWTCEALVGAWRTSSAAAFAARETLVGEALQAVNARIRAHAKENGFRMMGTTVVGLLQDVTAASPRARIFHVGDSRAYRYRLGRLDVLTRDHTVGNELGSAMAATYAHEAASLRSRSNPLTHVLTRAVGTEMRVRPEWKTLDLQAGDRFLFCSDGVHDMLSDPEIAAVLKEAKSPQIASK